MIAKSTLLSFLFSKAISDVSESFVSDGLYSDPKNNPCRYPNRKDRRLEGEAMNEFINNCNIDEMMIARATHQHAICNYRRSISSEDIMRLSAALDEVVMARKQPMNKHFKRFCVCRNQELEIPSYCWYRFGIAVTPSLGNIAKRHLFRNSGHENVVKEFCAKNATWMLRAQKVPWDLHFHMEYGNMYADIVRRQWKLGLCGEDILILVVRKRPTQLLKEGTRQGISGKPMIFLSLGREARQRILDYNKHHYTNHLEAMLRKHNDNLSQGYLIPSAVKGLLTELQMFLSMVDIKHQRPHNRSRIPVWAQISFGACGGLLIVMGIGHWLTKVKIGRRMVRNPKQNGNTTRKWKAGFVGGMFNKGKLKAGRVRQMDCEADRARRNSTAFGPLGAFGRAF